MMIVRRDEPLRIAYVEDNPADVETLLSSWRRFRPRLRNPLDVYGSAETFLAAMEQHGAQTPDVLLVDLTLPGMQGVELIRRLRTEGRGATLPIVVLTGSDLQTAKQLGVLAGADFAAQKPIKAPGLLGIIGQLGDEDPDIGFVPDFELEVVRATA